MQQTCDLHTHSVYSDGTFRPEQIVEAAVAAGLSAVALTDHNTFDGLDEFVAAAEGKPIEAVPGIELSTGYLDKELHIVGLFLRPEHYGAIRSLIEQMNDAKRKSNLALAEALNRDGYRVDYDAIIGKTPNGQVNRAHFAVALTEAGYTASVREAFDTLLSSEGKYYRPPCRPDSVEVISLLSSVGVVPVLAHPFLQMNGEELALYLPGAVRAGLVAMETRYTLYSEETEAEADRIAAEFGLLPSGGSDFHGETKPGICLGTGRGSLTVPTEYYLNLKEKARH